MKIAICSPLNVDSAIGRVAIDTASELIARGHVVDLVSTELECPSSWATAQTPVFWTDPNIETLLQSADIIAVHIGDNFGFHAGAVHILKHWRCTGIFHDANIYGLFRMWAFHNRSEPDGRKLHDELLSRFHGTSYALEDNRVAVPTSIDMIPWLAAQCSTALAHSSFYVPRLQAACPGEVFVTPLTYSAKHISCPLKTTKDPDLRILTVGHVNANKCCDSVIEALGGSSTLRGAEYRIAGPVSDTERDRLTDLARANDVRINILGRVSDSILAQELYDADIVSCLRRPVLEGGSASAVEAMLSAKPIVVVDAGFYADIADGAALKIPANFTVADLQQALDRLAGSSELRLQYGLRGQAWATENCDVRVYVDVLEQAMRAAIAIEPFLELAKTYAHQLQAFGIDASDHAWHDVADRLQTLVGEPHRLEPAD